MPSKHVPAPLNLEVPTKGFEVDHIFPNRFSLTSPASDAASTHNFYIRSRPCSPEPAEGDNNVLNLNGHAFFSAATFPNPDPDVEPLVRLAERRRTLSIKTTATTRTFLRVRRRADTAPSAFNEDEEFATPAPKGKDHSLVNFKRIAKNAGVIKRFHKKKPSVAGVENLATLKSPKSAKEKDKGKEKDKIKEKEKAKEKEKEKAKEKEKRKSAKVKVKAEGQTTTPLRSVTKAFFRRRRSRKDSDATSPPPQVRRVQSFTAFLNAAGVDAPDDASDTDSIMEEANAITNTIHQEYDFVYEPEVDGSVYFVFGEAY